MRVYEVLDGGVCLYRTDDVRDALGWVATEGYCRECVVVSVSPDGLRVVCG